MWFVAELWFANVYMQEKLGMFPFLCPKSSSGYLGTCCRPDPAKSSMPLAGSEPGEHLFFFPGTR